MLLTTHAPAHSVVVAAIPSAVLPQTMRSQDALALLHQLSHARVTPAMLAASQVGRVVGQLRKHASEEVADVAR
jgi:hypothetical protein